MQPFHSPRTPGRPNQQGEYFNPREQLLLAARRQFSTMPFAKVTIRALAEEAGVNAALIRYYFTNKQGLYEQMLADIAKDLQSLVTKLLAQNPENALEALLNAFAQLSLQQPEIPRLIFKEAVFGEPEFQRQVQALVIKPNHDFLHRLFNRAVEHGHLAPGFDPRLILVTVASMAIMPHLVVPAFGQVLDIKYDADLIASLVAQQSQILKSGCYSNA